MRLLPQPREFDVGSLIRPSAAFRLCFEQQPDEAEFPLMRAYNMLVPPEARAVIRALPPEIAETEAGLRRMRVPVLIMHGRRDAVVLPASAEHTASLIGHAQLFWYEACGHSPFFEDASRFNQELAAFTESVWNP